MSEYPHRGRVPRDEVVIDAGQQLVAAESPDDCEDPVHVRVGERLVKIGQAVLDRRGQEVVAILRMVAETHAWAKVDKPPIGFRCRGS